MNEEYLTVRELSEKTRFSPQTIYNKISRGEFEPGKHYVKPSRKKVLFKVSAINEWLGETFRIEQKPGAQITQAINPVKMGISHRPVSRINI
ncbi:MAG: helix-turn-helix domain-containing protein [Desulfobacterales bacterium]